MGNLLAGTDWVLRQGDIGRQQGQEKRFNMLAGRALGGDQDAYQEQVSIDPGRAQDVQKAGDVMVRKTRGAAKYMQAALDSGNPLQIEAGWRTVRPFMAREYPDAQISEQWDDSYKSGLQSYLAKTAYLDDPDSGGMPTGFREAHMKAVAAGFPPGSDEYKNFFRVGGGIEGRAPSGGFSFRRVSGMDGKERDFRDNPRTGETDVFDELAGGWVPYGGAGSLNGGASTPGIAAQAPQLNPQQDFAALSQQFGIQPSSTLRSPQRNAEVGGVANSYHLSGEAPDYPVPPAMKADFIREAQRRGYQAIDEGDHVHIEPPRRGAAQPMPGARQGLNTSRSPEEQAALTTAATEAAKLTGFQNATPAHAERVGAETTARKTAENQVDAAAELPKVIENAEQSIALLDKAINHPGREIATGASSMLDPRNKLPGSPAFDFNVVMDQIRGQAFLQAYQSLKGGGAITDREGAAATDAIGRLKTAQSEEEFVIALNDLKAVISNGLVRAKAKARAGGAAPATAPAAQRARNPQTGEVLELRNGQWVPVQ